MAGSNKWFVYTTNDGTDFTIYADESNTEAVNGGTQDLLDNAVTPFSIPKNLKPRYAVYKNIAGTRTIKCVCLTAEIYNGVPANVPTIPDPIGTGDLTLAQLIPERISPLPRGTDTGLNDGDAS